MAITAHHRDLFAREQFARRTSTSAKVRREGLPVGGFCPMMRVVLAFAKLPCCCLRLPHTHTHFRSRVCHHSSRSISHTFNVALY